MIHARLFVESPKHREEIFTTCAADRPLLVQFCANDPDMLLEAAKMVAPVCDGVDINFGCPQRIAKKGRYGAFLMDDWATIDALIRKLDEELPVPVTAKIRVYDDLETSVKYAQMVEAAGAQLVAVHGRTREQKRAADVRANWAYIAEIKKTLKVPVLANGDVRTLAEARKCLEATGADGVLSADPLLENPSLFSDPPLYEPSDPTDPLPVEGDVNCRMLLEYLELTAEHETPLRMIRGARAQDGGAVAQRTHGHAGLAEHDQVRSALRGRTSRGGRRSFADGSTWREETRVERDPSRKRANAPSSAKRRRPPRRRRSRNRRERRTRWLVSERPTRDRTEPVFSRAFRVWRAAFWFSPSDVFFPRPGGARAGA